MAVETARRFEQLVLPHLDDAYTLARYLLRDEHDAQDAVQEAALRALRHVDALRGEGEVSARAWVLAIVRNCCYTWQARRRVDRARAPFGEETALGVVDPRATDDRAIDGSERARIHAAVAELSAELREVLVLREVNDLSYREISDIVGVPMGTVMSRLSRARKRLAAVLGGEAQEVG